MKYIKLLSPIFLLFICFLSEPIIAQVNSSQLEVGYLKSGQVDIEGFSLSKKSTIQIEGYAGLYERMGNNLLFYGWILDGKTREVVWSLLKEENDRFFRYRDPGEFSFNSEITLPAGDYEVYYAAGLDQNSGSFNFNLLELIDLIFDGNSNNDRYDRRFADFSLTVIGPEKSFERTDWHKNIDKFSENAIVSIVRAGDNEFVRKNFSVEKEIELNIYSSGEQYDGDQFDFAWIVNSNTYEKVWPKESTRYKKAGGGRKNKMISEKIKLPKGNYTLFYISDDSHSFDKWNVLPPNDPQLWGVSIWTEEKYKNKVRLNETSDSFVLKLNKAGDNDYLSQAFKLKKDMKIRVYCIGERSGSYDMADYGWIINADTHEKVWEFKQRYSEYAGGGQKNRMINEEIELEEGNYIAYYITDGSHSFRNWNASPPLIPDLWGLNILVNSDRKYFELVDNHDLLNDNVLAEIIRVRDNEYKRKTFVLENDSKIRIYAIGEGDRGGMDDTGWIKSKETGKIVLEMTFRNTDLAGGAHKNRLFDGTMLLPKGEYNVFYETDGSHSFRDWNASPPHDQEHYGISIYLIK